MKRRQPVQRTIPSSFYTEEYFLSDACEGFDAYLAGRVSFVKEREIRLLESERGMRVLDVGCGRGELVSELAAQGIEAVAIDHSPVATRLTRELTGGSIPVVLADATALPFRDAAFDRVVMGDVIEHIPWQLAVAATKEVGRVVTDNGFALVHTAPNAWFVRFVLPIVRFLLPVGGSRTRTLRLRLREYVDRSVSIHPNELSPRSLKRLVSEAGLTGRVWVDPDVFRSGQSDWTRGLRISGGSALARKIAGSRPIRLLLGNDLYARVRAAKG